MGKWRATTEKVRDERTGKWEVKFFAVSPDGQKFPCTSYNEALQCCMVMQAHGKT
jgi:hypothetical protein